MSFGIPMIHAILEWRNGSAKPVAENTEATKQVESLYLPVVESTKSADEDDNKEADVGEGEDTSEQDQDNTKDQDSEDEHEADEQEDNEKFGCVRVIENAEFDFDEAAEADGKPAASRSQPLLGLVLTPTRELAVQVKYHIDAVAKYTGKFLHF